MMQALFTALGLVLVIEGLLYALVPGHLKAMMQTVQKLSDDQLRIGGVAAMAAGEANATVELTPNMAGPAFAALSAFLADGTAPEKFIITESKLYTPADNPQGEYDTRKGLGY